MKYEVEVEAPPHAAPSSSGLIRRAVLWTASILLICLSVYGFVSNDLFRQNIWIAHGLSRFLYLALLFVIAGILFNSFGRRYFRSFICLLSVVSIWSLATAGAVAGGIFCLVAFLSLGDLVLGRQRDRSAIGYDAGIALAIGASIFIGIFEYTARSRIHYSFVYLFVLIAVVALNLSGLRYWFLAAKAWLTQIRPPSRLEFALEVTAAFFLFFYVLLIVKPEIGADSLAQHLTVPAIMAMSHRFNFDVHQFVWAFAPMGSDWLFSLAYGLGGEFAARVLNFFFLCGITYFVFGLAREISKSFVIALLCVVLWLSTPLVELVTGSLYSENLVGLLAIASLAAVCAYRITKNDSYVTAFALLLGGSLASKFGAISFFIPLIPCLIWMAARTRHSALQTRTMRARLLRIAALVAIVTAIGAPAYVRAWQKTGNPFFPFMNEVFKSPQFPPQTIENRFHSSIDPRTIYAMTYQAGYLEAFKGSFGFEYLVLIPLVVLAVRRSWPLAARLSVLVGVCALFISMAFMAYSRYLYADLPLVITGSAAVFQDLRKGDKWLYRLLFALALLCVCLNGYFLPASGWYHRGGFFNPLHETEEARDYERESAPARQIIAYLNAKDPGARVAFLTEPAVAGLDGVAFTYNWYNLSFANEMHDSRDAKEMVNKLIVHQIRYFIGHSVDQMRTDATLRSPLYNGPETPALRDFIREYLTPEFVVNNRLVLYRWKPSFDPTSGNWARPGSVLTADPNPLILPKGEERGITTITWSTTVDNVEVRLTTPDGPLFAMGGSKGSATTAKWVADGVEVYLQDHGAPNPTSYGATLAKLTLNVQ